MRVEFFVPGIPRPQGSKRHLGNGVMVESSKHVKDWRAAVAYTAAQIMDCRPDFAGGVAVTLRFEFQRPKSHYRSVKGTLQPKDSAPSKVTTKPDIDKIVRAVLDACAGVVWADDAQVYWVEAEKVYGPRPGVSITVSEAA